MVDDFEDRYRDDYNPKDYSYSCYKRNNAIKPEPESNGNGNVVWEEVIKDMRARDDFGEIKYKTRLKTHNGRDPLVDAFQEALDLAVYLKQCIMERDGG